MKTRLISFLIAGAVVVSAQADAQPRTDREVPVAEHSAQSAAAAENPGNTVVKPLLLTSKEGLEKSNALRNAVRDKNRTAAGAISGPRLWYAGFGLEGSSKAFAGDVKLTGQRLQELYPDVISYIAYNDQTVETMQVPLATLPGIENATYEIGRLAKPQDVAVIMISSHGNQHILGVKLDGEYAGPISDNYLEINLRKLKAVPTVVIISACHSGSMIDALKSANRIIITAAAADKSSYGCQPLSENTFFIDAMMGKSLNPELSLHQLFAQMKADIAEREKKEKLTPSDPQMYVGEKMKSFADKPISSWLKQSS
jgi:hypothetical protein